MNDTNFGYKKLKAALLHIQCNHIAILHQCQCSAFGGFRRNVKNHRSKASATHATI